MKEYQQNLFHDIFGSRYPDKPGFKAQETSREAAESMEPTASGLQRDCLLVLLTDSMTADEVAERLNKSILAIRPRLSELLLKGLIKDSGSRRQNASGKYAIVWRLK